ncbi:MHYT domain-containing protein [[Pseudomonas] boreopolis]|uniref:MHYT domain-containing protein n=1 Tax=Xanthomonas boreopolis TaxID=86183 RepID=UPI003D9B1DB3
MPHDHAIHCVHDPILMLLSYLVSVLGSFTALQIAISIPAARTGAQRWQAVTASGVALGAGAIWAMHFIAMLACRMEIQVTYDLGLTALSAVVGIASCMVGLALAGSGVFGWGKLLMAGLCMGLGVAGMHYTGMAAMKMPATTHYDMGIVGVSVVIAVVASTVALWLAFNLRGWVQMLGSALVMGVAVCGMHYTGMYAASFVPNGEDVALSTAGGLGGDYLGMGIFVVATALLTVMLLMTMQRRQQRASVSI